MRYVDGLATTLGGAAVPYGYTVVVWSSGGFAEARQGAPHAGDVVAFAAGAVVVYATLRLLAARGHTAPPQGLSEQGLLQGGAIHLTAIAAGVALAWLLARTGGVWGWFLPPLAGTGAYLSGTGVAEALKLDEDE